ncbi:hypothetical protein BD311DRAFT_756745 [Dichomitus squalens]|uniref:Uncharacterized protein n=1 Tax=Dichomitus squalens TaxID=114155 RepID=A0A4Q9MR01_9APHY|nr:hypothetical protein BD311DRAFT_756745 [Dichomitus squalens]
MSVRSIFVLVLIPTRHARSRQADSDAPLALHTTSTVLHKPIRYDHDREGPFRCQRRPVPLPEQPIPLYVYLRRDPILRLQRARPFPSRPQHPKITFPSPHPR